MTTIAVPDLLPAVADFVSRDRRMLIGGQWVDALSGRAFDTHDPATGQVYDRMFVRHWDSWNDHTQNHLFVQSIGANGRAVDAPVWATKGFDGDTPSKPFGDESDFVFTPAGDALVFSARLAGRTEPWSTNFDLYRVALDRPDRPENLTRTNPAWDAGPVFSADDQFRAIDAIARKAGIDGLVGNFLRVVARNRRLFAVPPMIASFRRIAAAHRGEVAAEVTSAHELTAEQTKELQTSLKQVAGKDVAVKLTVDPALLGGLIVKIGSRQIDTSLRTKLNSLKLALKEVG